MWGFVDSDDWIDMDMYKTLMLVVEKYNCDIVSMGYTTIDQVEKKKEDDAALFYPCCLKAKRIFVLKEYKYYYRIRENSMCRKFNINTVFNIYSFYLYMKKILLKDKNQYDLLKQLKMYTWSFLEQSIDQLFNIRVGGAFIFPYEIIEKNSEKLYNLIILLDVYYMFFLHNLML